MNVGIEPTLFVLIATAISTCPSQQGNIHENDVFLFYYAKRRNRIDVHISWINNQPVYFKALIAERDLVHFLTVVVDKNDLHSYPYFSCRRDYQIRKGNVTFRLHLLVYHVVSILQEFFRKKSVIMLKYKLYWENDTHLINKRNEVNFNIAKK